MCDVNIVLTIITADPNKKQQFVLSDNNEKISFPNFNLIQCNDIESVIKSTISTYFKESIIIENLLLIGINNHNLNQLMHNNSINILYGLTIPKYETIQSYYWKPFSFSDISIPNELSIIGETVRRVF